MEAAIERAWVTGESSGIGREPAKEADSHDVPAVKDAAFFFVRYYVDTAYHFFIRISSATKSQRR